MWGVRDMKSSPRTNLRENPKIVGTNAPRKEGRVQVRRSVTAKKSFQLTYLLASQFSRIAHKDVAAAWDTKDEYPVDRQSDPPQS